ncbi:glycosyltransferase [Gryllotalpicola reticulitermitis]|uniref:Glycosyltransferase n=1 Tax=Gryllotalpicola reticulitermitis TaxID=1184153 RepID=A0ABV8Q5B3_9MICO
MPAVAPGVVSVVLVNFRGTDDTLEAITRLREVDWPAERLEIVVVENASGDGSLERLRAEASDIVLVESRENLGFAGGCNLGVAHARGEYLAFLNNDAKPEGGWVRGAVARFEQPGVGAVASRVLDWDGERVDFIGAAMTWFGMGYKPLTAQRLPRAEPAAHDVLFGTGSAMFVRRSVFESLGGFDERFFMFFEDVDFGWRLNLAGWRFVYEPASTAYHKHHASMSSYGAFKEQYLLERNALYTLYKNLGDEQLAHALPAAMALAVRRATARAGVDSDQFDLRRGADDGADITVPKDLLVGTFAIDQFVEQLPSLVESRVEIQHARVVPDHLIWPLFGETDAPSFGAENYLKGYDAIMSAFPVGGPTTTRVLIVTGDPIGSKMAGPAIRAFNMGEALSAVAQVTLASFGGVEAGYAAPFQLEYVRLGDQAHMRRLEEQADVIIFQGLAMALFEAIEKTSKIVVADVYDPMHLEQLEQAKGQGEEAWSRAVSDATNVLNQQLARGDFFLAASERQRHLFIGQLAALGRINPLNYRGNPDLSKLIATVPFGLSSEPPVHEKQVLKGVLPGIGEDDKVLLWSGGLYNWFDPHTLIRAVAELAKTHPDVRLFFQGTKHPHPGVPEMEIVATSRALASELGVADKNVFFNASWVDYAQRQNYLLEADAGVSTHYEHIETTFSFRTRILDYLWAGLPMVVTAGDHFAELIEKEKLGVVVGAEDVEGLVAALEKVLYDERFAAAARRNVARVAKRFRWQTVLQPLVDFVADARHAPDLVAAGDLTAGRPASAPVVHVRKRGLRHDLERAVYYVRNGGVRTVADKVLTRFGRN